MSPPSFPIGGKRTEPDFHEMSEPPSDSWLFAQAISGNRVRVLRVPPRQPTDSERLVEVITGRQPDTPRADVCGP